MTNNPDKAYSELAELLGEVEVIGVAEEVHREYAANAEDALHPRSATENAQPDEPKVVFSEQVDLNPVETFGVRPVRKRKYPQRVEPGENEMPSTSAADPPFRRPSAAASIRGGSSTRNSSVAVDRKRARISRFPQLSTSQADPNDYRSTPEARVKKEPLPRDQKYCSKYLLKEDYTLEKLLAATFSADSTKEELAQGMADAMGELKPELILEAMETMYRLDYTNDALLTIFERVKEVEQSGGWLTNSGYRRRTPGGVFLFLVKAIEEEETGGATETTSEMETGSVLEERIQKIDEAVHEKEQEKAQEKAQRLAEEKKSALQPPTSASGGAISAFMQLGKSTTSSSQTGGFSASSTDKGFFGSF